MTARIVSAVAAGEGLIVAAVIGLGAALVWPEAGLLALGLAWYLPLVIDRARGRA